MGSILHSELSYQRNRFILVSILGLLSPVIWLSLLAFGGISFSINREEAAAGMMLAFYCAGASCFGSFWEFSEKPMRRLALLMTLPQSGARIWRNFILPRVIMLFPAQVGLWIMLVLLQIQFQHSLPAIALGVGFSSFVYLFLGMTFLNTGLIQTYSARLRWLIIGWYLFVLMIYLYPIVLLLIGINVSPETAVKIKYRLPYGAYQPAIVTSLLMLGTYGLCIWTYPRRMTYRLK